MADGPALQIKVGDVGGGQPAGVHAGIVNPTIPFLSGSLAAVSDAERKVISRYEANSAYRIIQQAVDVNAQATTCVDSDDVVPLGVVDTCRAGDSNGRQTTALKGVAVVARIAS